MTYYYPEVPGLGPVAVSRHAQAKMETDGVSEEAFRHALFEGEEIREGFDIVRREHNGVRVIIIMRPTPWRGARLVKTAYLMRDEQINPKRVL